MELKRIQKQEKIQEPLKQKYKNRINSSKGITIVALVITIVLMLILAGTTISLTMKGDGIFSQALQAKEKYKISEYKDRVELARVSVSVNNMGEVTLDNLIAQIYKEKIVPEKAITKLDEERAKMKTKEGYTFIITADKIEYAGKGDAVATPPDLQEGDVVFNLEPNTWTNGSVKVSIEGNIKDEFTLQYSLDTINWMDYTKEIEITENRTIYACIRNAIGEQGNYASSTISIIDKIDPENFLPSITSTTNSITVDSSEAKDGEENEKYAQSGIKEIWYSKDAGTTWETNEENKTNTEYTFIELTQGQEYEVQVKVIDNAGNQTITKAQKITTTTVAGLTVTVGNADTWTNGTKTITITASNNNYSTIRYTTDGTAPTTSSTAYTKAFTVDKNCIITAVAFDSTNQAGDSATNEVTKIDKLAPTGSVSVSTTTNSAKVTVTASDQAATSTNGKSEIKGYYYSSNGGSSYTSITTNTSYTFSNLAQNSTYNIRVKVVDNAGNETVLSPAGTVTTGKVTGLTVTVGNADTWTNGTKQVTISAANSNYSTIRYTTDGSTPTTSSTAYTKAFTVSSNCTVTALAFDSTNQVGASATKTVTKIDTTVPQMVSITKSGVSWSGATGTVTITGKAKDVNAGINAYQFSTNASLTASSSGWTSITATTAETTQTKKVTATGTYYFYVKDQAGNINKNSIAVTISDTTKPTIGITANTTSTANSVTLTGTSQDTGSGIVGYAFTTTSTQPTSWTGVTQTTSQISKTYKITSNATVYFWTKDAVGNVSSISKVVSYIVPKVSSILLSKNEIKGYIGYDSSVQVTIYGRPRDWSVTSSTVAVKARVSSSDFSRFGWEHLDNCNDRRRHIR